MTLIHLEGYTPAPVRDDDLAFEDLWILSRLATVTQQVTAALDAYHYADAARTLYDFAWDEFCSRYAEMAKPRLEDPATRAIAQRTIAHVLDVLLRLLHPMIPFLTEEVWQLLGQIAPLRGVPQPAPAAESVVIAPWPEATADHQDNHLEGQFARFLAALDALHEIRTRQGIAPRQPVQFCVRCDTQTAALLRPMERYFQRMANATSTGWTGDTTPPATHAKVTLKDMEIFVDLEDLIDVEAEIERNAKQEQKLLSLIAGKEKKLANQDFLQRAPAAVVQREQQSLAELQRQLASVREALAGLRTCS